ncbi:PaaI family thioesterase [Janibacter sp. UYMM211]|uniref:PaaI family thioesterase n=1 Tax=Janibacter sp. UYMM211 TaxID=3156342 RepID=UPI0033968E2E
MFESSHPDRARQITASFDRQGLMHTLGARLGSVESGEVHIHLPMSPAVTQQHGMFHGGVTTTVADSAGGYAALTLLDDGSEVLTVELKVNFLAPARGEELEAVGSVIKSGRTLSVCRLEVYARDGDRSTLVAVGQQTVIRVDA